MTCPFEPGPRTVFLLSHPNHEVAVWGLVRHLRPAIIFLTDGGGGERLEQTKRSLANEKIDAVPLDTPEAEYYEALLRRDAGFFRRAAARVADAFRKVRPARVFTDAVEFYNPVHDLALPIARAAAAAAFSLDPGDIPFFEIPLVHQVAHETEERYLCQQASVDRRGAVIRWELPPDLRKAKLDAWTKSYTIIADQMAPIVKDPREIAAVESVLVAGSPLREPGSCVRVRYEWRGQRLKEEGKVRDVITRKTHYLPAAASLMGAA